jgi:hypothetical protein
MSSAGVSENTALRPRGRRAAVKNWLMPMYDPP